MRIRHPSERGGPGRARFGRLAEAASNFTASGLFYALCVLLVAGYVTVSALGLPLAWRMALGDAMTAVTLLLIALLKNSERRAEHAVQRKLDAIANALLEQKQGDDRDARKDLEAAIGMDEEI
ncbi:MULTISPECIES: low affinity iron permease family protein [Kitasatospora]|uniref:Low affinity Fe/Cu permease n=2 Tax=Kitasatospora TaxID=2063 RepID=A0ABT1J3B8_9ACTN|nr:low affinity iron permease family protein [Kitasatospora paracochleata]MCP2311638.1 low affinity Fe/Cu permease [Kitasatospora paracochleata]